MNLINRCQLGLLCVAVVFLCGCGGGEEQDAPLSPAQNGLQPASPSAPTNSSPSSPQNASAQSAPDPAADNARNQPPPEDRDNLFAIVDPANFEVLGPSPGYRPEDVYEVSIPGGQQDSSSYVVVERPSAGASPASSGDFEPIEGFAPVRGTGFSDSGMPLRLRCEKDDSILALVPDGGFRMGTDNGPSAASPSFGVFVKAFYMDVTEVTVGQFNRYREERKKSRRRLPAKPRNTNAPEDHPALGISWGDARMYAKWAGKDLPTEAQWEKAARGEDSFRTPWGNGRAIWHRPRTPDQVDPVGSFRTDQSPYGILDLAGNAREWCLDWYSDTSFQEAAATGQTLRNWTGPKTPSAPNHHVVKGNGPEWNAWHRSGVHMSDQLPDIGFRCVLAVATDDDE